MRTNPIIARKTGPKTWNLQDADYHRIIEISSNKRELKKVQKATFYSPFSGFLCDRKPLKAAEKAVKRKAKSRLLLFW